METSGIGVYTEYSQLLSATRELIISVPSSSERDSRSFRASWAVRWAAKKQTYFCCCEMFTESYQWSIPFYLPWY